MNLECSLHICGAESWHDSNSETGALRQEPTFSPGQFYRFLIRARQAQRLFAQSYVLFVETRADAHVIVTFFYRKRKCSLGESSERVQPLHSTGHLRKFPDLDPSILYRISFD